MSYTVTTTDAQLPTFTFARKDRAIKAGLETGVSFTVTTAKGNVVHTHEVPVVETAPKAKRDKVEVKVVEEVGATIIGLTTVALTRTCKKGADHEFRVTQSGTYCYTCDRIAAEAQKAARALAKATGSTGVTVRHERRNEDGSLTTQAEVTYLHDARLARKTG